MVGTSLDFICGNVHVRPGQEHVSYRNNPAVVLLSFLRILLECVHSFSSYFRKSQTGKRQPSHSLAEVKIIEKGISGISHQQ